MSLSAYARHRDVSLAAVQKAIKAGRISVLPNGQIDSDAADEAWERNTRRNVGGEGDAFGAAQYSRGAAVREHYQARLAKLEFGEKTRSLVSADEVRVAAFNKFRQFRDQMLDLADRLAAMLAAESEPARCYEILALEVGKALNDFSDING